MFFLPDEATTDDETDIVLVGLWTMIDLHCILSYIVHVHSTGCSPVLLILQVLSLLCSSRELDALIARPTSRRAHLSQFCEVNLESFGVLVKPESDHGVKDVLAAYGLAFLDEAFLCGFACDEAYELRDAFLDTFLGFL